MAKGWLTRWYAKLIKIPFVLRRQMRKREKKIMHVVPHMALLIYKKIPEEVKVEHRVTLGMSDQKKVGKDAKVAEKAETELAFDEEVEETLSLRDIKGIETMVLRHEMAHGATGSEEKFGKEMVAILLGAKAEDRQVYFTYLEPVLKVAEKKGNYKALMEKIRLMGPSQTNIMAAMAFRLDIRAAGRGIPQLRADKKIIEAALEQWDKTRGNKEAQEAHLKAALSETEKDSRSVLHSDVLVAKRDFLVIMLTLKYIDDDEGAMESYYHEHIMPQIPEQEQIKSFEELKDKFAEDMHVLAQGMRRIFTLEQDAEKLAEEIVAFSHTKRKAVA